MKKLPQWLFAVAATAVFHQASASTTYGTLSNFDVFNDSTSNTYYGFEIELEGIDSSSIPNYGGNYYTYNNWHYGKGQISGANGNTIIRYYDNGVHSTEAYTSAISATSGHSCITVAGCEHFGVVLNAQPTATRYFWLDQNGNRADPLNLIGAPSVTVLQPAPNAAPVVQFVVEAPEAPEPAPADKFSDAVWVKVMKTELSGDLAVLDDLMADNPDKIADAGDVNAVEVEWKLLQRRLDGSNDPANKLDSGAQEAGAQAEQVLRTYQFFTFNGTYNEEHEATCLDVGSCEDDLQNDPNNVDQYVGRLIGQQMVAANLNGPIDFPAAVPLPGAVWLLGPTLLGLVGVSRRRPS